MRSFHSISVSHWLKSQKSQEGDEGRTGSRINACSISASEMLWSWKKSLSPVFLVVHSCLKLFIFWNRMGFTQTTNQTDKHSPAGCFLSVVNLCRVNTEKNHSDATSIGANTAIHTHKHTHRPTLQAPYPWPVKGMLKHWLSKTPTFFLSRHTFYFPPFD